MTRVVYFTACTLDGFIADEHDSLDWLFEVPHDEDDGSWDAFISRIGPMVAGTTTYRWMLDRHFTEHPEQYAEFYGDRPLWVFTHQDLPGVPGVDVRFVSGDVKILGKGEIQLRTGELAHEFTLLVPPAAVRRAPKEMRSAFTERADGLSGVDFRVWGPYRSPRTDLQDRVLRGFAESILRKGLRQFLR